MTAAVVASLAEEGRLMRNANGTVSVWQPAGEALFDALCTLAERGALPEALCEAAAAQTPLALGTAAYMSLLKRTQATYSTSYVEDCDALKAAAADGTAGGGDALSPRARLSLQFRRSQKKMLSLEMTRVSLEQKGPKKSARSEQTAALHTSLPRQEDH